MIDLTAFQRFLDHIKSAADNAEVRESLALACETMGFQYYALTQHSASVESQAIRLYNYPSGWVRWFDENNLSVTDPVHRASEITCLGFSWSDVPAMIKLTRADREILGRARREGIGDGFTVPAHVPGEVSGSCSFAVDPLRDMPDRSLPMVQLVGAFAFEAARRLNGVRNVAPGQPPVLTDRQRDCVLWAARGKTAWEIAQILGLSEDTVIEHLKLARERYQVPKQALLAIWALFDGLITFSDIIQR
jgi:LuxR family quorum-sensing system transcriptional regulator CciR